MAALAAGVRSRHLGDLTKVEVQAAAADTFYLGALVFFDTAGRIRATLAAGYLFAGVVATQKVIAAAGELLEVYINGVWIFSNALVVLADEGAMVYGDVSVNSDNPADLVSDGSTPVAATGDIAVGQIFKVLGSEVTVAINQFNGTAHA